MRIELLVASSQEEPALALCKELKNTFGDRIAAAAVNIEAVVQRALTTSPDVLLLEHPEGEAHDAWGLLGQLAPLEGRTRILLHCDALTQLSLVSFVRWGVSGCVLKSSDASLCAKAVMAVHSGETWFGRTELLQALRTQVAGDPAARLELLDDPELLTAREREILSLVGGALSNKEIARRLNISDKTVKTHLHHIYVKLHKSGRYKAFLSNAPLPARAPPTRAPDVGSARSQGG